MKVKWIRAQARFKGEIDRRMAEIAGAKIGESYDKFVGGIALGRAETPEDVAAFVSYLAGPRF